MLDGTAFSGVVGTANLSVGGGGGGGGKKEMVRYL